MMEAETAHLNRVNEVRNSGAEDVTKLEMPRLFPQRPRVFEADWEWRAGVHRSSTMSRK
jgi:hypothetical protein